MPTLDVLFFYKISKFVEDPGSFVSWPHRIFINRYYIILVEYID